MQSKDNIKVVAQIKNERVAIPPQNIAFESDGNEVTLGDMLDQVIDLSEEVDQLNSKLEAYIKVEAQAQKLLASAHDELAVQLTKANARIAALEEYISALKAKDGTL
jgi:hypothetical protein